VSASEVSAFEPQPPAESNVDMPEFVVVRRGVDRRQVEEWGRKLTSLIERERRRAEQAERALYRTQVEATGTPSFTHLGSHAAGIIEEAGQSAERMLLDAAERAQEALAGAEAEAAGVIEAAEGRAGEIEGAARQDAERLRAEGARVAEEVREAAEALLQEAERKRVAVEGETRRLEALRQRTHEQLARMYGHLESVLDEVRRGIGGTHDAAEEAEPG
jgi:cell division septum initiation protein DivIVA